MLQIHDLGLMQQFAYFQTSIFVINKFERIMSILTNHKKDGKKNNKGAVSNVAANKFAAKPGGKAPAFAKKPIKTGGTRGS